MHRPIVLESNVFTVVPNVLNTKVLEAKSREATRQTHYEGLGNLGTKKSTWFVDPTIK